MFILKWKIFTVLMQLTNVEHITMPQHVTAKLQLWKEIRNENIQPVFMR